MVVRYTATGPRLAEADLAGVEAALGVSLPAEYRAFLLERNGGAPKPNVLSLGGGDEASVEWFYSIGTKRPERDLVRMTAHFRDELGLPKRFLPVALAEPDDLLLLTVGGKSAGRVSLWSIIEEGFDASRVRTVAKTFGDLLRALESPKRPPDAARRKAFAAMEEAIHRGDLARLRALAEGADLKTVPRGQAHPIFAAIFMQNAEAVRLLVQAGTSPTCRNLAGETPLESARSELAIAAFS